MLLEYVNRNSRIQSPIFIFKHDLIVTLQEMSLVGDYNLFFLGISSNLTVFRKVKASLCNTATSSATPFTHGCGQHVRHQSFFACSPFVIVVISDD